MNTFPKCIFKKQEENAQEVNRSQSGLTRMKFKKKKICEILRQKSMF